MFTRKFNAGIVVYERLIGHSDDRSKFRPPADPVGGVLPFIDLHLISWRD
jgi:hypothetical protein